MQQMNKKFKYGQYEICVNFRNENCFWMSAQCLTTQQIFMKADVELTRIKKDTVFATLEKKSEKNLKCELEQVIIDGKRYLLMYFIVNFDYLPEFTEQVRLDFIEKKDKLQSIPVNNFQSQIDQMERVLNSFQKNGLIMHKENAVANSFSGGHNLWSQSLTKGKYLLRCSGIYTNTSGGAPGSDSVTFKLETPGNEDKKTVCSAFSQYGYPYPISFSEIVEVQQDGDLKVTATASISTCSLTNCNMSLSPIFELV